MNTTTLTRLKKRVYSCTLIFLAIAFCNTTYAIGICQINTTPLNFGNYYPMQSMRLDSSATLNVSCRGSAGAYQISASAGLSNDYSLRRMYSGLDVLTYNMHTSAARTTIWGDGTTNTSLIIGTHSGGNSSIGYTIYGSIAGAQNVNPGLYTDVITVTLFF